MFNPYIAIPFATWAIAQTLKFAIKAARGKIDFKYLYASGGMPSVHSAVVMSLTVTALLLEGPESSLFGFTAIFAAIVMYDSFGVRRSSGEQAAAINELVANLQRDKVPLGQTRKLREILGHTPLEVTAGALLGSLLAALFNIDRLSSQMRFLLAIPGKLELTAYIVIFAALVLGGAGFRWWQRRKHRSSRIFNELASRIMVKTQTLGWVGLAISFSQSERAPYLSYRLWSLLLLVALVGWDIWLYRHYQPLVPQALLAEQEEQRRQKWFKSLRRKKQK